MMKKCFLVSLCLLLVALPIVSLAQTLYVVTSNGGGVNLRLGPSTDDEVLAFVGYGQPVELIDMMPGSQWANVNYNGYYGYIMIRYLSDYPPVPDPTAWPTYVPVPTYVPGPTARPTARPTAQPSGGGALEKSLNAMFNGFRAIDYDANVVPSTPSTYVNLRWAPSKSAPVRGQYWSGSVVEVLSENGTWSEVIDPSTGMHGFIMSHFLTPAIINGADSGS